MGFLFFSTKRERDVAALKPLVAKINTFEPEMEKLSDAELKDKTPYFKNLLAGGKSTGDILPEAFAVVREAAKRTLKMRHFDVQMMGGIALYQGRIAEMKTGEGKTLAATLPVYLRAVEGKGVHVVTVNDYLAQRDADHFRGFYGFCGLTSGCVTGSMASRERAQGHAADITYTTSKEILADFLRDRLCLGDLQNGTRWMIRRLWKEGESAQQGLVMRGLHTAIVDEADSVLIDEAVTPLIISGSAGKGC